MPTNDREYAREYMRKYRLRKRLAKPGDQNKHLACDQLLAKRMEEKDTIIANQNREIGRLKESAERAIELMTREQAQRHELQDRILELEKPQVVQTMHDPLADLDL